MVYMSSSKYGSIIKNESKEEKKESIKFGVDDFINARRNFRIFGELFYWLKNLIL